MSPCWGGGGRYRPERGNRRRADDPARRLRGRRLAAVPRPAVPPGGLARRSLARWGGCAPRRAPLAARSRTLARRVAPSPAWPRRRASRAPPPRPLPLHPSPLHRFVKGFAGAAAGLALTLAANAADVKLGADSGALVFDPASVTISEQRRERGREARCGVRGGRWPTPTPFPPPRSPEAGDSVTFKNNAGFPHNIVFDEDAVPEGVKADALSHEDYLNAPGETYTVKLTTPGEYNYYCEPHQGAGMAGKIMVQ